MPYDTATERDPQVIHRRSAEWQEFQLQWRWLLDSYEGGERYRSAIYGYDWGGLPVRNLIRHKREYPDPRERPALLGGAMYPAGLASGAANPAANPQGTVDSYRFANDSDYELRRARTPIPCFVREAVETHLSKIFTKEVTRDGPQVLQDWWEDVDGKGTPIGAWIQQEVGPLFLVLGQIDLLVDHPPRPVDAAVATRADQVRLGLDRAVASYILPENILWWRLAPNGQYAEVLVQELVDEPTEEEQQRAQLGGGKGPLVSHPVYRFRHWTTEDWCLYDNAGEVIEEQPHPYGRVPVVRVFDRRKARLKHIGQSRYEGIAERQREYYNRDSELILSDTIQAHPLIQGPEDYCKEDATVPIGPGYLLPKKKNGSSAEASYEGFDVIDFPKGAAESLRENLRGIRDEVDRDARLTKPAGVTGTGKTTVAQSGVSKQLDHQGGHELMSQLVEALGRLETTLCELALTVLADGPPSPADVEAIDVVYPTSFSLQTADELALGLTNFQALLQAAGECPDVETLWLQELAKEVLKGQDQATYEAMNDEIEAAVAARAQIAAQMREGLRAGAARQVPGEVAPPGAAETGGEEEAMKAPAYSPYPSQYGGW
jgi:hypothetical protein